MSVRLSEFARGWRVLAGSFVGIAIGVSSLYFYSLGIFIKPMAAEFGWGRGAASLGALVGTGCAALMAIPMGRIVDRVGSVPVAVVSLLLLALGFGSVGWLTSGLTTFLVLTAIISLLTAGSSPLPYTRLVVKAFEQHRGIALGITLAGTGMGAILIPALLAPFVALHGWRAGYLVLAGVVVVLMPLVWWLLMKADDVQRATTTVLPLTAFAANPAFRLLASIFFLAAVAVLGTVVQFLPMLTDWGLTPVQAGSMTGLIGVAAIGGRLLAGAMLDRFPPWLVTTSLFAIAALGIAALAIGGISIALPGALVVGLAVGAEVDLIAFLVARYFTRPVYGQTYGAMYAAFLVGGAIGPALSGYLQQASGDYRLSLFVAAGLLGAAALMATRVSKLVPAGDIATTS